MRTLVLALATVAGAGYAPVASGTVGSLVALPFLPLLAALRLWSWPVYAVGLGSLVALAVWAAGRAERELGVPDSGKIVIDEVAGLVVAGAFVPGTWLAAGLAFGFFRLFDVLKPFPARQIDRETPGGIGIVGDDLVAGVYAGLVTRLVLEVL